MVDTKDMQRSPAPFRQDVQQGDGITAARHGHTQRAFAIEPVCQNIFKMAWGLGHRSVLRNGNANEHKYTQIFLLNGYNPSPFQL